MTNIFNREKSDGLEEKISSSVSVAYVVSTTPVKLNDDQKTNIDKVLAAISPEKVEVKDLYFNTSILASSVWNLNDDIFLADEIIRAKDTPVNKPSNANHKENVIIGHILSSYIVDEDLNLIDEKTDLLPDLVHIVTNNVIYRTWSNDEYKELVEKIISGIEDGTMFVSMECGFTNFDYALMDSEGKQFFIERNEETSFLTKHLRCYGGSGEYEGYKVGRVLRNITFIGKGYVENPANPASVIFSKSQNISLNKFEDGVCILQLPSKASQINSLEVEMEIEELQKQLAELVEANKNLQSKVDELSSANASLTEENAAKATELEKIRKEQVKAKRVSLLLNAGLDNSEAESKVELYSTLSDDLFANVTEEISAARKAKKDMEDMKCKVKCEESVVIEPTKNEENDNVLAAQASASLETKDVNEKVIADVAKFVTEIFKPSKKTKSNK